MLRNMIQSLGNWGPGQRWERLGLGLLWEWGPGPAGQVQPTDRKAHPKGASFPSFSGTKRQPLTMWSGWGECLARQVL